MGKNFNFLPIFYKQYANKQINMIKKENPKNIFDISWQVNESVYREYPALSYSILSKFEREGFNKINNLYDKISSPAIIEGSMVDCLITSNKQEFDRLFYIADFPSLGEKETQIIEHLYNNFGNIFKTIEDVPKEHLLNALNLEEYQKNWKDETRINTFIKKASDYYQHMINANGRTVVNQNTYNKIIRMVEILKNSGNTYMYFRNNDPDSELKRYYQLKFKSTFDSIEYKCMADLLLVDYEEKVIYPIDLKTSSNKEWNFQDSFLHWNYMIQARLYWRIIRDNLNKDPYFKNFKLENYRFVVINKESLIPLVWEFPLTASNGTLVDIKGNKYRDPFEIGKELQYYLNLKPQVPIGIYTNCSNIINCLKIIE